MGPEMFCPTPPPQAGNPEKLSPLMMVVVCCSDLRFMVAERGSHAIAELTIIANTDPAAMRTETKVSSRAIHHAQVRKQDIVSPPKCYSICCKPPRTKTFALSRSQSSSARAALKAQIENVAFPTDYT